MEHSTGSKYKAVAENQTDKTNTRYDPVLSTRDFMVSGETFRLYRHPEIEGLLMTDPVPEQLGRYYESPDYLSHQDRPETLFGRLYKWARNWNIRWKIRLVDNYVPKGGNLLEIGTGQGDFLKAAESRWRVMGVEPNPLARQQAREKELPVFEKLSDVPAGQVDCILLWHVLEHIADLEKTLPEIVRRLQPQGQLILAMPNYKSWDARYYKSYWAAYDVPRHLWHFSRQAVEDLFSRYGMKCIRTRPMWLDAFYVSWLSEKYRGNRLGAWVSPWVGLASNFSALFTRQASSVVYVLRAAPLQAETGP